MQRRYFNGERERTIEELDDVLAVKPSESTRSESFGERATQIISGKQRSAQDTDSAETEREAFEQAGWVFVVPSTESREAFQRTGNVDGATATARVYEQRGGRLVVGSQTLTVRFNETASTSEIQSVLASASVEITQELTFAPNMYEVRVTNGADPVDVSVQLHENEFVVFAEPQFIEHIGHRFTPTDGEYGDQWHLNNTGQSGGTAGADIAAETAWDATRGAGVRLSVIDNGMDVSHPDLAGAIVGGAGFFQNNGMGGANFVQGTAGFPGSDHGTFCAGMAVARANNDTTEGGVGVANLADLIPIACLNDQVGTQATLARAISYAADPTQEVAAANPGDGADVIACSLGPNGADWDMTMTLQTAIDFAVANGRGGLGTPIFWAVTNGNFDIQFDEVCSYVNTIHVGRSTRMDLEDNCGFGPELDFLATGVDVFNCSQGGGYRNWTGTSFAAPTAAGVGALMLSVNPNLTWQQVRQIMRDTAEQVGGVVYDAAGHNDDYGWGRINAADAVCASLNSVNLDTPTVTFNEVPEGETAARAIVFSVERCAASTFQIISGPTVTSGPGSFGTLPSPMASLPSSASPSARQARLWLSFQGQNDGDITGGTVTVRLVETGDEWIIPITANTIARPTVAVALVLDQSGSMTAPSGVPAFPTRNDALKFSAPIFVNALPEGDGIGVVDFDHDAYDRMPIETAGPPSAFDTARNNALTAIANHTPNPLGMTAIGDGVEHAHNLLAPVTGFDSKAMVVFTDGHETESKYISDVAPLINDRVFAIGLGTADQVKPAALNSLTNSSGGYLLLTGDLGNTDLFRLSKYYLQILAGVTNHDIVLDPDGYVLPGQVVRIPFHLNEADIETDVILLSDWPPQAFVFALETPAGDLIDPSAAGVLGGEFVAANGLSYYRMTLPVALGAGAHAGKWNAIIAINPRYTKPHGSYTHGYDNGGQGNIPPNGLRYSLSVHSYSGIRLVGSVSQSSNEPGAIVTVRGVMSEYGIPIEEDRVNLVAEIERPDGTKFTLGMSETTEGVYEATYPANQSGVYPMRLLAKGKSLRGRPFTREHLLSAGTWKGGDQPPPSDSNPSNPNDKWCDVLRCLIAGKAISEEAAKQWGIDLKAIEKCLARFCRTRREGGTKPRVNIAAAVTDKALATASVQTHLAGAGVDQAAVQQLLKEMGASGLALSEILTSVSDKKDPGDCGCGDK